MVATNSKVLRCKELKLGRLNYITVRERDFGNGIDQQSAENNIPAGHVEDIQNMDPKSTGYISKRTGYQGFAGYLPVRVESIEHTSTSELCFTLNQAIELPTNQSSPLLVSGRTETAPAAGDFGTTDTTRYYPNFTADIRKSFQTGTNTLTIEQEEHGINSNLIWVGTTESTNAVNNSNTRFETDSILVNQSTNEIEINYTNNTTAAIPGFVFTKDATNVAGTFHNEPITIAGGMLGIEQTFTVPATTHNLDTFNLLAKVFVNPGSSKYEEIKPDSIEINSTNGLVTVKLTSNVGYADAIISLTSAPTSNFKSGSIASGATGTVVIDTSVSGGTNFAFISAYLEETANVLEEVEVESVVSDASAQTITVTFINNTNAPRLFNVVWCFVPISTNTLCVTSHTALTAGFVDSNPQLTIWGLSHEEIYGNKIAREGWVNHIDSYRSPGESRLISGLGGNLFRALLSSEDISTAILPDLTTEDFQPTFYPRLNARAGSNTTISPAFHNTGATPGRTRGFITGDDGGSNFFEITDIAFVSGNSVKYTISVPNLVISGTLGTIIDTTSGESDKLTTSQCGLARHNGTFDITSVTSVGDTLEITVTNELVDSSDFDETDVGGLAGIFTDRIPLTDTSPFQIGDVVTSGLFPDTLAISTVGNFTTGTIVDGITETLEVPGGLRLLGTRTSSVVPIRDVINNAKIDNIVRGDMLTFTGLNRQLRVRSINQLGDTATTITSDGSTATVTLGSGDTATLFVGKKLLFTDSTNFNGVQEISEVLTATTFQFESTAIAAGESATITGNTIEVDEDLTYTDTENSSNGFIVHSRWIPIEAPEDDFTATPKTRKYHFDTSDYDNQSIIRSTTVQDNLYLTNDNDEVLKFDGANIYRAGLFRWQPNLFVTTTTTNGRINVSNPTETFITASQNRFTFSGSLAIAERVLSFQVGDIIIDSQDSETYTIQDINLDETNTTGTIAVDKIISGTAGTKQISRVSSFKYYFRLNAVDANDNVIASAVTGSDDFVVELGEDADVNIRLVGMPIWDIYDYDRLEVQIYRTKANQAGPFYHLSTIAMNFDTFGGYVDYIDTDSDEFLLDLDETVTALKGAELGTAWTEPPRAKYCTSAGNRLILGNLKDYPQLDIQVLKEDEPVTVSDWDGKKFLFRKSNLDTATDTDMTNRINYEMVDTSTALGGTTGPGYYTITLSSGNTVTTGISHGLTVGDWVYLYNDDITVDDDLLAAGWYQVETVPVGNQITINVPDPAAFASSSVSRILVATDRADVPVPVGLDGNYAQLNGNRETDEDYSFLAMKRLAEAINVTMRQTTVEPWMIASAGNEFNSGQLIVRQPRVEDTTIEVKLPTFSGFSIFVNNIKRDSDAQAGALTRLFPSRIVASYQNFPEIFDNPTTQVDSNSDSAIDINSADGQEITSIIPFFGDAAFGAAQKSGIVVVFKTNSIYLVDLSAKDRGENPVQKLETRGKGCTMPFSVSVTRGGIMFANDTGIYRLNRNLTVEYIGRKYERKFKGDANLAQRELFTGHHDTEANSYKLSYVTNSGTENSEVAVYNHTREYERQGDGSWTTYTNHPVTGWANLDADSYFAATNGRVFIIRKLGEVSDYRDDNAAIVTSLLTRALDVMDSGRRKVFGKIITHYRAEFASEGTTLKAALDLSTVFQDTDTFKIQRNAETTGIQDTGNRKIVTIVSAIDKKAGVYIQLKYENSTIDEPLEIAGIDFRVGVRTDDGITEAIETT